MKSLTSYGFKKKYDEPDKIFKMKKYKENFGCNMRKIYKKVSII